MWAPRKETVKREVEALSPLEGRGGAWARKHQEVTKFIVGGSESGSRAPHLNGDSHRRPIESRSEGPSGASVNGRGKKAG